MEETFGKLYEHLEKLQQKNVVDYFENPKLVNDDQNAALESFIQKDWTSPFLTVDDIHNLYIMFEYSDRDIYKIITDTDRELVQQLEELVQLSGSMAKQTTLSVTKRQIDQLKELAISFYNNSDDLEFLANGLRKQYLETLNQGQWSEFNAVCVNLQKMFEGFIYEMDARPPESSNSSDGDYVDAQSFGALNFNRESFGQQFEARQKIDASQQEFNNRKTSRSWFSWLWSK